MRKIGYTANDEWIMLLGWVIDHGTWTFPRGKNCLEIQALQSSVDMKHPVITIPERKISNRFMLAEAIWIMSGSDSVEDIVPYNKNIAAFSDDGETFFGAYGPKICSQCTYVMKTLANDPWSRQAVINIWRENPRPTKDVPCTLSLQFLLRPSVQADKGASVEKWNLDCVATMRSSDLWLGYVYDVFNFSMVSAAIALDLIYFHGFKVDLGVLYLTAGSQHLYDNNVETATFIRNKYTDTSEDSAISVMEYNPINLNEFINGAYLLSHLVDLLEGDPTSTFLNGIR